MTLVQMEYLVAVDRLRNFQKAADACFVTQPTLSQQIQKAEHLLGVMIFDRSKQPIEPTPVGKAILNQIRQVLRESEKIKMMIQEEQSQVVGDLRLGIIPTLAPFLLPRFIRKFSEKYPAIRLYIEEKTTEDIVSLLREDKLDLGLLVSPLHFDDIIEQPLFLEELFIYASPGHAHLKTQKVQERTLAPNDVYLLSEGHCFRDQVLNLCRAKGSKVKRGINFESGSLQTLKRLVDETSGYTILPRLAVDDMLSKAERERLRPFTEPVPSREVSLVSHKGFIKTKMAESLATEIQSSVKGLTLEGKKTSIVEMS